MAGTKRISALPEMAADTLHEDDIIPVVDMSASETKHVKAKNVLRAFDPVKARFATVAAFLADNNSVIGYSGSGARVIVADGDIIEAGSFRYSIRATGASDNHVATAGGVKADESPVLLKSDGSVFLGTISPNTQDGLNVGIGRDALRYLTKDAGEPLQRGVGNVGIGADVMSSASLSADYNTGVGFNALQDLTTGYCNSAFGLRALSNLTTAQYNTAVGCDAGAAITIGDENTAVGSKALLVCTDGTYNVAVGSSPLYSLTGGDDNVAVGTLAGYSLTTGNQNIAIGSRALYSQTVHSFSTAIGHWALRLNTAAGNTAVGHEAGAAVTTNGGLTALGTSALKNCDAINNTAIGNSAGTTITSGESNTIVGAQSAQNLTIGDDNVAIGEFALFTATDADRNVAIGSNALYALTTGDDNIAIGNNAASSVTTASNVIGIGSAALLFATGGNNVGIGLNAGRSVTTGTNNVYVGNSAGFDQTTGTFNTAIGHAALDGSGSVSNSTGVGSNTEVTGSNQVQLGDSATTTYAYGAVQDRSDSRDKADIRDTILGLDFIKALRPVDFKWDYREDYNWGEKDGSQKRTRYHHGLIAQEVRDVLTAQGVDFGGFQDHSINGGMDVLSIGYQELIGPLIKAIQQLEARVAALESA